MKSVKPELYYDEKGNPKGYRVGISNGVYGTCPFCGKSYTEEDITNGDVNFEHIFSRFAVKKAIDEPKVFSKIESEFMVGVHKDCNDRCSLELERQISRIVANVNKTHVHLMQDDVIALFNYCIKTSIFLRYLFMWEDNTKPFCYDTEKISLQKNSELIQGLNFYKDFVMGIQNIDASAGLYWGINLDYYYSKSELHFKKIAKCCFSAVLDNVEIDFFYKPFHKRYGNRGDGKTLFIKKIAGNRFGWVSSHEYYSDYMKPVDKKGIPWKLDQSFIKKMGSWYWLYKKRLKTLSGMHDDFFGQSQNYFIRQSKLSLMSQRRFEENKILPPMDRGIIFCRKGQFYLVNNDGIIKNISEMPADTEIPAILFLDQDISHLPDISHVKAESFRITHGNLISLIGAPQFINQHLVVIHNKLKTLEGCPKHIGGMFLCAFNELTSLKGAPKKIYDAFSCGYNKLTTLVGGPEEVALDYSCDQNQLTTLEGAPQKVGGNFYCRKNKLKSLKGAPKEIGGTFYFDAHNLESLDYLPKAQSYFVGYMDDICDIGPWEDCFNSGGRGRLFFTEKELREWFVRYKNEQKIKKLRDGTKAITTLAVAAYKNKNIPDDQHEP